jgi:hypothetical protein
MKSDNDLYKITDSVAQYLVDIPLQDHDIIVAILQLLPLSSMRGMIASLSDAEFTTSNENLIHFVASFLKNENKAVAQTSAIFLLSCCGELGEKLINAEKDEVPHKRLVNGIIELIGAQKVS